MKLEISVIPSNDPKEIKAQFQRISGIDTSLLVDYTKNEEGDDLVNNREVYTVYYDFDAVFKLADSISVNLVCNTDMPNEQFIMVKNSILDTFDAMGIKEEYLKRIKNLGGN